MSCDHHGSKAFFAPPWNLTEFDSWWLLLSPLKYIFAVSPWQFARQYVLIHSAQHIVTPFIYAFTRYIHDNDDDTHLFRVDTFCASEMFVHALSAVALCNPQPTHCAHHINCLGAHLEKSREFHPSVRCGNNARASSTLSMRDVSRRVFRESVDLMHVFTYMFDVIAVVIYMVYK